jgi:hypothetical protein
MFFLFLVIYITVWSGTLSVLVRPSFRTKRLLLMWAPNLTVKSARLVATAPPIGNGAYDLEKAVFTALNRTPPRELPLDLAAPVAFALLWCEVLFAAVFQAHYDISELLVQLCIAAFLATPALYLITRWWNQWLRRETAVVKPVPAWWRMLLVSRVLSVPIVLLLAGLFSDVRGARDITGVALWCIFIGCCILLGQKWLRARWGLTNGEPEALAETSAAPNAAGSDTSRGP